jgi:predicted CopG family antitoxin
LGKWNRSNFKVLTLAIDVYNELKGLKQARPDAFPEVIPESFSDLLRRILREKRARAWSVALPVKPEVRQFWTSGLFGGRQQ